MLPWRSDALTGEPPGECQTRLVNVAGLSESGVLTLALRPRVRAMDATPLSHGSPAIVVCQTRGDTGFGESGDNRKVRRALAAGSSPRPVQGNPQRAPCGSRRIAQWPRLARLGADLCAWSQAVRSRHAPPSANLFRLWCPYIVHGG